MNTPGLRAMVRDLFPQDQAARMLSLMMLVMGVAPILAPFLGGQLHNLPTGSENPDGSYTLAVRPHHVVPTPPGGGAVPLSGTVRISASMARAA